MIVLALPATPTGEYRCCRDINLYNSPTCQELATQAAAGRQFKVLSPELTVNGIEIQLCEDGYGAWLSIAEMASIEPAILPYRHQPRSRPEIESCLPEIIAFTQAAMNTPNHYRWGGTIAPDYDCSGLMQAAFAASGIWLPRDSYQQEAFCHSIDREDLLAGDLIFFGNERVNHVALYLGDDNYIHSSGRETGRDGIGIDTLSEAGDEISRGYYRKLWGFGRVMAGYCPPTAGM